MRNKYYIITSEKGIFNYTNKAEAMADYRLMAGYCKHLRLEVADAKLGTARVIKERNNIW